MQIVCSGWWREGVFTIGCENSVKPVMLSLSSLYPFSFSPRDHWVKIIILEKRSFQHFFPRWLDLCPDLFWIIIIFLSFSALCQNSSWGGGQALENSEVWAAVMKNEKKTRVHSVGLKIDVKSIGVSFRIGGSSSNSIGLYSIFLSLVILFLLNFEQEEEPIATTTITCLIHPPPQMG